MKRNPDWSRRDVLKGLSLGAGAIVLAPILRAIRADAMDLPTLGPRVVFLVEGCGFPSFPRLRVDQTAGRSQEVIETRDFTFGRALKSLAPLRDQTTMIDGLANLQGPGSGGNHTGEYIALSCRPLDRGPGGITIDRHLAATVGKNDPFGALHLGVVGDPTVNLHNSISAGGPRQPVPLQCAPKLAWREVFGGVAAGADAKKAAFEERALLDYLNDDLRRARASLAGTEREKLDQYAAALETLSQRRQALGSRADLASCAPNEHAPVETYVDRFAAQIDLAAAALICGLTRVVTLGSGAGYPHYAGMVTGLGLSLDKHALAHGQTDPGGAVIDDIHDLHARMIVRLAAALRAAPERNGTVFDQSVIVYLNDNADEHHSRYLRWPAVIVGNAGGKLRGGGRHLRFPGRGQTRARSLAELWNTICHALGTPKDDFARAGNEPSSGPIPELLA